MEKTNLQYSTKNIPTTSERNYKTKLLEKIEAVIRRMRWKAIFFDEDTDDDQPVETYGLKTNATPAQVMEMVEFEKELIDFVRKVKFRKNTNQFQYKMKQDMKNIVQSNKVYVPADKTSNMYLMSKEQYDKHLVNAITKTYKKSNDTVKNEVIADGKRIMKDLNIIDRMCINGEDNCFITLKDHKDNFQNNPTTRLINPAKNELGRISKSILEKLNKSIRESLQLQQWKSTSDVLQWFNKIKNKQQSKFIVFDIKDFYPSISENLLTKALKFAEEISDINQEQRKIILHARKSLLYSYQECWRKKGNNLFDVTMGAYDGAEVCELVGCYILNKLSGKYNKSKIGLYRDDGLAVFENISGPQSERIKKDFQKTFRDNGLEIVIQCNMKVVDYLDVTLNLTNATYQPYRKPDNITNYIHTQSNHPPTIIKQVPLAIEKRLSNLSSSEEIFKAATPFYEDALQRSGYNHNFAYHPANDHTNGYTNQRKKNRKRNIIWFNPPFDKNVSTNIGKNFLNLIRRYFPKNHKFHKIFNKNTVKVSYSCMPNIKSIISSHNRKTLDPKAPIPNENERTCNCIKKDQCPLQQKCLTKNVIYKATITTANPDTEKEYIGLCETTFKKRYANHKKSFNHEKYKNSTTLSTEFWRLKTNDCNPLISWKIIRTAPAFSLESGKCHLCLTEKFEIANFHDPAKLLNKRSEVISKCRHQRRFKLASFDTGD